MKNLYSDYFDISVDLHTNKVNLTYVNKNSKYFKIRITDMDSNLFTYSFDGEFHDGVDYWCVPIASTSFSFLDNINFNGVLIEFFDNTDTLLFDCKLYRNQMMNDMSINLLNVYKGHFGVTYKGVEYLKCPMDYVMYQMLINKVKPDLIIEVGTYKGGGALYLADLLELIGSGVVHSIDIKNDATDTQILNHKRIKLFTDGFENYDIEKNTKGFNTILVIDDASHHYTDVLKSLNKFSKVVSKYSYFIVEDGVVSFNGMDDRYDGGPRRAIGEFLEKNKNFIIDRYYCDFFGTNSTFNPDGYLRKIS